MEFWDRAKELRVPNWELGKERAKGGFRVMCAIEGVRRNGAYKCEFCGSYKSFILRRCASVVSKVVTIVNFVSAHLEDLLRYSRDNQLHELRLN